MNKITSLTEQLAATAAERKDLEVKEKALKDSLLAEMKKVHHEKEETVYGTFTISRRSSYTYTPAVKALEEEVKMRKDEEQKRGLATESVTEYILFKEAKV